MNNSNLQMGGGKNCFLTEDAVRDIAREILSFENSSNVKAGVRQLTTFNQLGFPGVANKPDSWYLPSDIQELAIILETKNSNTSLREKEQHELLKNCNIVSHKYGKVIEILYNGEDIVVFKNTVQLFGEYKLHNKEYYFGLFDENKIDKQKIYLATKAINDALHFGLTLKNLYHRMIFTACALVAKRCGAQISDEISYDVLRFTIEE